MTRIGQCQIIEKALELKSAIEQKTPETIIEQIKLSIALIGNATEKVN
ncbi:MAG: hypothetical protein M0036_19005 [Desulfobacteraceae bacterium]|nr:hypothetical protein [Desulfobacteraceae bacterium]